MNSKARFIPLIVLGAIVLSLIAVIPVFSAAGNVRFYDGSEGGDPSKDQKYARAGGNVYLEVDDRDLNTPVKYVILPDEVDAEVNSDGQKAYIRAWERWHWIEVIVVRDTAAKVENALENIVIAEDDTIAVGSSTIRRVESVSKYSITTTTQEFVEHFERRHPDEKLKLPLFHAFVGIQVNAGLDERMYGSVVNPYDASLYADDTVIWKLNSTGDDAKINVDDCPTCAVAPSFLHATGSTRTILLNTPVVDSGVGNIANRFSGDKDTRVNSSDVYLADGNGNASKSTVESVDNNEDRVELNAGQGKTVYAVYWGSTVNNSGATVEVRSSGDTNGIDVVLTETGNDTGVFRGTVSLTSKKDSVEDWNRLRVNPSGTVTLRYDDDGETISKSIDVETTAPSLSNFSPAHDSASEDERPEVMADVIDSDSGLSESNVYVVFALLDNDNMVLTDKRGDAEVTAESVNVDDKGRIRNITGGFRIEQRLPQSLRTGKDESTIAWWVIAEDKAGNIAVSDRDTSGDSVCVPEDFPVQPGDDADAEALRVAGDVTSSGRQKDGEPRKFTSNCQAFIVKVDDKDPVLEAALTGAFWDTDKTDDDKTNEDASAAKTTSIMLKFDEDLDGSTVSASDFRVGGSVPLAANHYAAAANRVFLDVPALAPDARPDVELVSDIKDIAGNIASVKELTSDDNNSQDGIGPTLEVTIAGTNTGARPVTKKEVTITVVANENISNPTVTITLVGATDADGKGLLRGTAAMVTPILKSPRTYEATWETTTAGLYNVYVSAPDSPGGKTGTLGKKGTKMVTMDENATSTPDVADDTTREVDDPIDLSSDTKALLFEVDNAGPEFTLDPAVSDNPTAFVRVSFSGEGSEYSVNVFGPGKDDDYIGSGSRVLDVKVKDDDDDDDKMSDLDSYSMVTLVSATLAGTDISDSLERLGDDSFLLVAPNLDIGKHKVEVEAEDSAGNKKKSSMDLEITERKPFKLSLRAGVSIISFPGEPMDPDINAVFPLDHPVQEVITYDPTQPGLWFASKRDETTGMFDGNLMTISGNRGYLVRSNSTRDVSVVINRPSLIDLGTPPVIELRTRWNLVPVTDITYKLKAGDVISYADYFGDNPAITRVLSVDTILGQHVLVRGPRTEASDDLGDDLEVGKGYWVFATEDTFITPGVASSD